MRGTSKDDDDIDDEYKDDGYDDDNDDEYKDDDVDDNDDI